MENIPAPRARTSRRLAAALICAAAVAAANAALAQGDGGGVTLSGLAIDTEDDNRFFTRLGGAVRDDVTYAGLTAGQPYTLVAQLHNMTTGELVGEPVAVTFTPEAAEGSTSIELPVPQNRTEFNIDYVVTLKLYEGEVDAAAAAAATPLAEAGDTGNAEQTIQVHAIQRLSVTAADAADGDRELPPEGGTILASVTYENLVPGYHYTLWGQLLTPSGQSTGIFASIPEFVPEEMNGTATMEFAVPEGREGIRLVPVIGIYHQNRVSLGEDGSLTWLPEAPNPVMIASDPAVDDPEQTVNIGTPFEDTPEVQ